MFEAKDWFEGFVKVNVSMSLRKSEVIPRSRVQGLNRKAVE